jgi:RimJ/RimL family protein N-acetyltransferase
MFKYFTSFLVSERLLIKPLWPEHAAALYSAIQPSVNELQMWLPWASKPLTQEDIEKTIRTLFAPDYLSGKAWHGGIFLQSNPSLIIGMIGLNALEWSIPSANLGYWISKPYEGQGYIHEAAKSMIPYAFNAVGIKRLTIRCDEENTKSQKVAQKLGFEFEALTKGTGYKYGHERIFRNSLHFVRFNAQNLEEK